MKKGYALLIFKVLAPIPATKFTAEIQSVLLSNYLKLYAIAKAHDEKRDVVKNKFVAEGITDDNVLNQKLDNVMGEYLNEDAGVDFQKIDRTQFLAEATKAGVEITLAQIGVIEPMFNA